MELETFVVHEPEKSIYDENPTNILLRCSQEKLLLDFCNKEEFWRIYFDRRNVPLLEKGDNILSWMAIYNKSRQVYQTVNFLFSNLCPNKVILNHTLSGEESKRIFLHLPQDMLDKAFHLGTGTEFYIRINSKGIITALFSNAGILLEEELNLSEAVELASSVFYHLLC